MLRRLQHQRPGSAIHDGCFSRGPNVGESPREGFAFGSYPKGKEAEQTDEWMAKNVTPILYREHRHHAHLHRTLREWAETYRDGVSGKERIVVQYATARPLASTKQDDYVGRMLWALSDQRALPAKRFAEFDPLPSLDWLEPLSEKRFHHEDLARFGVQPNFGKDDSLAFNLVLRPTPYARAPWMTLVHHSDTEASLWDEVMFQIARWLARHLDSRELILWVARHGGVLHTQFAMLLAAALQERKPSPPMRTLWRLALSGRLQSHASRLDFYDWIRTFELDGLTPTLGCNCASYSPHTCGCVNLS